MAIVRDRYDRWINQKLLRKAIYPKLGELHRRRLRYSNRRRRKELENIGQVVPGRVFVVICVDTEGPCAYGQNNSWDKIHEQMTQLMTADFRRAYTDSDDRLPALSWFILDWVGAPAGPRATAVGHHAILDPYDKWLREANSEGIQDELYWHYHHCFPDRLGSYNRDWETHPYYDEILCRKIIERNVYPSVYRAGNTWEDSTVSAWLERFIPFDLSSRGPWKNVHYDWFGAPRQWVMYHPSRESPKRRGDQKRWMGRSVDMELGTFYDEEIEQAFIDASFGKDSYVSFYLHDFRPLCDYLAEGINRIRAVADRYPQVSWRHENALSAFRLLCDAEPDKPLELTGSIDDGTVRIECSHPIFGEPWLAVQTGETFERLDMNRDGPRSWSRILPQDTKLFSAISVAASDSAGQTAILHLAATK
jgi:hypothetical protein